MDPYERPPEAIRALYNSYRKMELALLDGDAFVLDFRRGLNSEQQRHVRGSPVSGTTRIMEVFERFMQPAGTDQLSKADLTRKRDVPLVQYQHDFIPGRNFDMFNLLATSKSEHPSSGSEF